ncbi:MAG TPA: nicotinate-nucleotide adenylyltransferase [Solirubrobacteraceae bacterium]|nr:nicotinate-nucleotide adenylyltransferase [Solirubrobacteraceae bacterium]
MADRSHTREQSLGILGGTFNPPHLGHLAVARHAQQELGLERVLLVPAHTAPYKSRGTGGQDGSRAAGGSKAVGGSIEAGGSGDGGGLGANDPGPQHRLRMCQLAVMDEDGLSVSAVEVERGGLSYTVDTLRSIHATYPHAQLTFIVGADTASTLGSWREPAQLLELAQLAVATRDGTARQRVLEALDAVTALAAAGEGERKGGKEPSVGAAVRFLEMPAIEVSSSAVRERVARGEAIDQLVGPAVAGYIAEQGLYRVGAAVGR